jgi:hypothetical protein
MPGRTRPIDKLATAVGKCSKEVHATTCIAQYSISISFTLSILIIFQSSVYGKCIFADYNNVHKNMCATEFMKLKECYLVRLTNTLYFIKSSFVHRRHTSNGNELRALQQ